MNMTALYAIGSVVVLSAVSLLGVTLLSLNIERLKKVLALLVSLSAGALFGDAFIHLLPEAIEKKGFTLEISFAVLAGIVFFFIVEKFIHWHHCHKPEHAKEKVHHFAIMNLIGDGVHNMIDGLVIGASYLISIPVGIATTIAVFIHEIPQEISDFGVLLHGGFSKNKALIMNFIISLGALVGVIVALVIGKSGGHLTELLIPFAAGGFIYIAGADLIPEIHKETKVKASLLQVAALIVGILIMYGLLSFEPPGHGHAADTDHDEIEHVDDHS